MIAYKLPQTVVWTQTFSPKPAHLPFSSVVTSVSLFPKDATQSY